MEDLWRENSFHCVADGMTEVEQISQSAFSFVSRHNMRLHTDRTEDYSFEYRGDRLKTATALSWLLLNGLKYNLCVVFERSKFLFVPNRCGLPTVQY